jgi:hypothetical protein
VFTLAVYQPCKGKKDWFKSKKRMPLRVVHKTLFSTEALRTTLGGNSKNHLEALYDVKTEKVHSYLFSNCTRKAGRCLL